MEGSKPGVTRLSGQRALRVTVCRIPYPHMWSFNYCRSAAWVENTSVRSTLFLGNGLPWYDSHWQSAHEPDFFITSCFPSRSHVPRKALAIPRSGFHGLGPWQGILVVLSCVLHQSPPALSADRGISLHGMISW